MNIFVTDLPSFKARIINQFSSEQELRFWVRVRSFKSVEEIQKTNHLE
jgi:hypothetical protein